MLTGDVRDLIRSVAEPGPAGLLERDEVETSQQIGYFIQGRIAVDARREVSPVSRRYIAARRFLEIEDVDSLVRRHDRRRAVREIHTRHRSGDRTRCEESEESSSVLLCYTHS